VLHTFCPPGRPSIFFIYFHPCHLRGCVRTPCSRSLCTYTTCVVVCTQGRQVARMTSYVRRSSGYTADCYYMQCNVVSAMHACMSSSRVALAHADNLILQRQLQLRRRARHGGMARRHVRCPAGRQDRSSTEQGRSCASP